MRPQIAQQGFSAGAQFVGKDQQAGEAAVDRHGHGERARRPVLRQQRQAGVADLAGNETQSTHHNAASFHPADNSLARRLHHFGWDRER